MNAQCGYEDYGIGTNHQERTYGPLKTNYTDEELEPHKGGKKCKLEQADAHVKTLPYQTGNTTITRDSGDFITNSRPELSVSRLIGKRPQVINYYTTRLEGRFVGISENPEIRFCNDAKSD